MAATLQYIEQMIDTYRAAKRANLETPARQGNVIVLDPESADEVLITADLHGHRKNFNTIKRLAALAEHPRRHLVLQEVCHGGPTYASNGGCMSHTMLEDVAALKVAFPERVHFLMSNHELAEATEYPILKAKRMLNLMFRLGMQETYGAAADHVRQPMVEFIKSCPLAVRLPGDVVICHSAPEQTDEFGFDRSVLDRPLEILDLCDGGDVFRMVWGRDYRPENARAFSRAIGARVLIHGHEPCVAGHSVPNDIQIILDCCGDKACYLLVPVGPDLDHAELVRQIRPLA